MTLAGSGSGLISHLVSSNIWFWVHLKSESSTSLVRFAAKKRNAPLTNLTGVMNDRYIHDISVRVLNPRPVLPSHLVCPLNCSRSLVGPVDEVTELRQTVWAYEPRNDDTSIATRHEIYRLDVVPVHVGPVQSASIEVYDQTTDSSNVVQIRHPVSTIQC